MTLEKKFNAIRIRVKKNFAALRSAGNKAMQKEESFGVRSESCLNCIAVQHPNPDNHTPERCPYLPGTPNVRCVYCGDQHDRSD